MDTAEMIVNLVISLLLTVFIYLLFPILLILAKRKFSLRIIKVIIVVNGIVGWILFNVLRGVIGEEFSTNVWPAFLWSFVAYWLMKRTCVKNEQEKGVVDREKLIDENSIIESEKYEITGEIVMESDELCKSFIDMQVQQTVNMMEANSKEQLGDETERNFGLVPDNPIYTHALQMVEGEKEYLSRLCTENGEKITWNRRGSMEVDGINGMIDIYDTYLPSGQVYKTIYINMYGAKVSSKAPMGFILKSDNVKNSGETQKEKSTKHKYCSRCGCLIDNATKICTGCGKQYFKGIRLNKNSSIILVLSIALIVSIIINVIQLVDRAEIDENKWYWEEQAETLREEKADLQYELWEYEGMADFIDTYIVFVEDDGTDWYHKYECDRFKANSFWAFNVEAAMQRGYTACPYCY